MSIFYGITLAVSLLLLLVYFHIDRKRNIWLQLLFIFVAICNTGYFLLSVSISLKMALVANTIAYFGNVFLPFFLLMMVIQLSYVKYPRMLPYALIALNTIMFLIVASAGHLPIYYQSVSFEIVDGVARLIKVYGPLHDLYKFFIFGYLGAIIAIICYTAIKKTAVSIMHTAFLAIVLCGNVALWLVENLSGMACEILPISYLMTEGLILLLYGILQAFENTPAEAYGETSLISDSGIIPLSKTDYVFSETQIKILLENWSLSYGLSQREKEVFKFILEKRKRKDIAQVLFVTESTIKKHTSNIYKKLEVANRTELFEKAETYLTNKS